MTKRKPLTATELAAEIAKLDLLPAGAASKRTNRLLRTMLNTAPDPHVKQPAKRAKK
jgi:hypothetical protein